MSKNVSLFVFYFGCNCLFINDIFTFEGCLKSETLSMKKEENKLVKVENIQTYIVRHKNLFLKLRHFNIKYKI